MPTGTGGRVRRPLGRDDCPDPTPDARADLLVALILGLNIAARGGASSAELERMLAAVHHQLADWR